MKLTKTVFLSGLAIAALAVPAATAREGRQMSAASRAAIGARLGATPQSAPRMSQGFRGGNTGRDFSAHRSGNWRGRHANWHGRHRDWHNQNPNATNRDHRQWHNRYGSHNRWHRRYYPRSYYSGFYPYGFGYPYGYGYGYGYPYYGSSAHLYYYGTGRPAYQAQGSGNLVVAVQQELAQAGYYRGAIDGVIGDGTRRAIRAYERANRLPVDGRIDDELLSRMGVS